MKYSNNFENIDALRNTSKPKLFSHRTMLYALMLLGSVATATPAIAQTITVKPVADVRLRWESVDQDGLPEKSDAVTVRVRSGVEIASGPWSARIEGQGNLAIVDDYFDGLSGPANRPAIADPENIALYRAQVKYSTPALSVTAGRQEINIDDDRFVGTAPIRQNAQNFDAARVQWSGIKNLKVDVTYAWAFRTFWGIDGVGAKPQSVSGDNVFVNVGYKTGLGTLTGFAYLVDQDEAAVQGFRLSSQTYGVRFAGSHKVNDTLKLSYLATYARQSDYRRNPNDYSADFYVLDGAAELHGFRLGGGYEVLGADNGAVLGSFQTPYSSGIKFLGWAGKFLPTPPDGVRDTYGSVTYKLNEIGPMKSILLQAVYHRFDSDRNERHYGDELDLLASAKLNKTILSLRYANYKADRFATDTERFWLQVDWSL